MDIYERLFQLWMKSSDVDAVTLKDAWHEIKDTREENEKLRAALVKAIDCVQFWAAYASEYFQDKHDLADDLRDLRAALGEKE